MQDNRNTSPCLSGDRSGMVVIDTMRVYDACRDRDCFEDKKVYLTAEGEGILASSTNIRTKYAKILYAFVGVSEVPFNCGFYQITVRYYVEVDFEACVAIGKIQTFSGLVVLEKDVVLFGGEGNVTSFSSTEGVNFCEPCNGSVIGTNQPTAVVETVEPVVLGTKVCEVCCNCCCQDNLEVPPEVCCCFDGQLVNSQGNLELRVSFGLFSIIRIQRPAQLLIQATDYSVPDKECTAATCNDNPCELFNSISFPVSRFRGGICHEPPQHQKNGGCNCGK